MQEKEKGGRPEPEVVIGREEGGTEEDADDGSEEDGRGEDGAAREGNTIFRHDKRNALWKRKTNRRRSRWRRTGRERKRT